ncbi:MAG: matrixin family metalloprotease [Chloroflexi bacterium]|nr:matrixin family metalloprotease [Chloroflexota bacterium]
MKTSRAVRLILAVALVLSSLSAFSDTGLAAGNGPPDKEVIIFVHYPKGHGPPEQARPGGGGGGGACPSRTFAKWADLNAAVTFVVDSSGSGLAAQDALTGVVNSVAEWSNWSGLPAPVGGTFAGVPSSYTGSSNGTNEVGWGSLSALGYSNAIAVTWTWRNRATKAAVEWDMVFNTDPGFNWAQSDLGGADPNTAVVSAGAYDVQNIGTHEAGHAFGLDYVSEAAHTMYSYGSKDEVKKRSLECGDKAGIQKLYGV